MTANTELRSQSVQGEPELQENMVLVRMGEIFLKGKNRSVFVTRLKNNLNLALKGIPWRAEAIHGRFIAVPDDSQEPSDEGNPAMVGEVLERLQKVFGVTSLSPALRVLPTPDSIQDATMQLVQRNLPNGGAGITFKVDAHRTDKRHPFTGGELNVTVGAAIAQATGMKVDLGRPDLTVDIEVGKDREHTFISLENHPGPGGLPVGVSGRSLLLLSGGIDSPVAGYLACKRGLALDAVYFHSFPYTGDGARDKVLQLVQILSAWGGPRRLHVVPFTQFQTAVRDNCPGNLAVLLYRRMMVRIASRLAATLGAQALVTGDSLGQVASQTLQNISCVDDAASLPILRPLITYDKQETINLAEKVGSYPVSIIPHQDCCSLFVPRHPEIKGERRVLRKAEEALDLEGLMKEALEGTKVHLLNGTERPLSATRDRTSQ